MELWKSHKSRDHFNRDWLHVRDHAYTAHRWPYTTAWRKYNLAAAHHLRRTLGRTTDAAKCGLILRISWNTLRENGRTSPGIHCRHDGHWCCYGNQRWNIIRFNSYLFEVLFRDRDFPCRQHGPRRCLGNWRCNSVLYSWFDVSFRAWKSPLRHRGLVFCLGMRIFASFDRFFVFLLTGEFPRPVVLNWFVHVRKLVKFVDKSLALNLLAENVDKRKSPKAVMTLADDWLVHGFARVKRRACRNSKVELVKLDNLRWLWANSYDCCYLQNVRLNTLITIR